MVTNHLEVLVRLADALAKPRTLEEKATEVVDELARAVGVDSVILWTWRHDQSAMTMLAASGSVAQLALSLGGPQARGGILRAINERVPIVENDYESIPWARPELLARGVRSACAVPLVADGEVHGVIGFMSDRKDYFSDETAQFLVALASGLASLVANATHQEKERERTTELELMFSLAKTLAQESSMQERLEEALRLISVAAQVDRVVLRELGDDGRLHLIAMAGVRLGEVPPWPVVDADIAPSGAAIRDRVPVIVDDYETSGLRVARLLTAGIQSSVSIPISESGEVRAVMFLATSQTAHFTERRVRLLSVVADQVGLFMQHARRGDELATLTRALAEIQETQSKALALELHDQLGQKLTALKLQLEAGTSESLENGVAITQDLITRVRHLALELRPAALDDLGLIPAIHSYIARFTELTGIQVSLEANDINYRIDSDVEVAAYRIVQEALSNVERHAKAKEVRVRIEREDDAVSILIEDRGVGMPAHAGGRGNRDTFGVLGMRERASAVGGSFDVSSSPGAGTTVTAKLPFTT